MSKPVDHVYILGMRVSLENPAGSTRKGTSNDGTPWESTMAHDYGYIRGTTGRDRDHLDVFLGPDHKNADRPVVVVDQHDPETGDFDEHKVMLGFEDAGDAMDAYHQNYPDDWGGLGGVREMPLKDFKKWAFGEGRRVKPAMALKRGGAVKMAAGGSVQTAKDLSPSQLSPLGGISGLVGAATGVGSSLLDRSSTPTVTNTTGQDFTNETIGTDVVDHFKTSGLDPNYFTGGDGKTYMGWNQNNGNTSGAGESDSGAPTAGPLTHIRQFAGDYLDKNRNEANPYDKLFNTDGTYSDVAMNKPDPNGWADFGSFALSALALASGNPALAFAKNIGSRIAMGALGSELGGKNKVDHPFGGVNKYSPAVTYTPQPGYAHGGRVGALSLVR